MKHLHSGPYSGMPATCSLAGRPHQAAGLSRQDTTDLGHKVGFSLFSRLSCNSATSGSSINALCLMLAAATVCYQVQNSDTATVEGRQHTSIMRLLLQILPPGLAAPSTI